MTLILYESAVEYVATVIIDSFRVSPILMCEHCYMNCMGYFVCDVICRRKSVQ